MDGSLRHGRAGTVDRVKDEEEKMAGRWAVTIPDTALMTWTEWDNVAAELTVNDLSNYGIIWIYANHTLSGKKVAGEYYPKYRREVGEALAHLTALARVIGSPPITNEDWKKHDSRLWGKELQRR